MSQELKPCPFCGNDPTFQECVGVHDVWEVFCKTAGCLRPGLAGSVKYITGRWNLRAEGLSLVTKQRDELVEVLKSAQKWADHDNKRTEGGRVGLLTAINNVLALIEQRKVGK